MVATRKSRCVKITLSAIRIIQKHNPILPAPSSIIIIMTITRIAGINSVTTTPSGGEHLSRITIHGFVDGIGRGTTRMRTAGIVATSLIRTGDRHIFISRIIPIIIVPMAIPRVTGHAIIQIRDPGSYVIHVLHGDFSSVQLQATR